MEKQKILIKTAYCLVGLSVLVLIGLTIFQQQQVKKLSENDIVETITEDESAGETIASPVESLQRSATKGTASSSKEIDELEYHLEAAEEELNHFL